MDWEFSRGRCFASLVWTVGRMICILAVDCLWVDGEEGTRHGFGWLNVLDGATSCGWG